jgi:hypothetical protein
MPGNGTVLLLRNRIMRVWGPGRTAVGTLSRAILLIGWGCRVGVRLDP